MNKNNRKTHRPAEENLPLAMNPPAPYQNMKTAWKLTVYFCLMLWLATSLKLSAQTTTYAPPTYRGKVILVVDKTIAADSQVAAKIDRLTQDLVGDGWRVLRHDVERGPTFTLGASRPPWPDADVNPYADWEQQNAYRVREVRALIKADYDAAPDEVKNVLLIGHVPVPYSGNANAGNVGGHYLGAKPADNFYGDMTSPYGTFGWSDLVTAPATYSIDLTTGLPVNWKAGDLRPNGAQNPDGSYQDGYQNGQIKRVDNTAYVFQCDNHPLDGKFDQDSMPSPMKLGVGRVDFFKMSEFEVDEATLMARYWDKDHDFRCGNFQVRRQAIFAGELQADQTGAKLAFGSGNVTPFYDYDRAHPASPNNCLWFPNVKDAGQDYLFGSAGGHYSGPCEGIGYTTGHPGEIKFYYTYPNDFLSSDSRVVFLNLAGSFMNNWESEVHFLRAPLANPYDPANGRYGYGLTTIFSGDTGLGLDTDSLNKRVLGATIGEALFNGYTGDPNHGLMGDPTLRLHTVLPPNGLTITISSAGNTLTLNWTASSGAGVAGYNVYRAPTQNGPYTLINTGSLVTGSSYQTSRQTTGVPDNFYMVRAVKTETTPVGSYINMSEGAIVKIPGAAIAYLNIQSQPANQYYTTIAGDGTASSAAFTVDAVSCDAAGNGLLVYQWYKNGIALPLDDSRIQGANTSALLIKGVQSADEGSYSVVVGNSQGSLLSSSAMLTKVTTLPVALTDSGPDFHTYRNTPKDFNVLANDTSGIGGGALKVMRLGYFPNAVGAVSINPNGTIHFIPSQTFLDSVTFSYVMTDGVNGAQGSVKIIVDPLAGNTPPTLDFGAATQNQSLPECSTIEIPFTVHDDSTTPEHLTPSLTCSSSDMFCQITGSGTNRKLKITGIRPVSSAVVNLKYTDEDAASSYTEVFHVTVTAIPVDPNLPVLSAVTYFKGTVDNAFTFSIGGIANKTWIVYSSPDLKTWTPVGSKTLVGGVATYTDPNVADADSRFYKLSDGTYSSRVVGFYRVTAGVGNTAIANQLDVSANGDASQNTLANVFQYSTDTMPSGTVFIKETDTSHPYTWNGSAWTGNGNPTLSPGEAGYIQNTSDGTVTLTFVGYVREWSLIPVSTGTSGSSFVSSRLPLTGGVQTVLNYQPTSRDTVHIWQPENHGWLILQYFNAADATAALSLDGTAYPAGWYDDLGTLSPEPTAKMGYPLIIYPATQNESWTQVYSSGFGKIVPSLSGVQATDSTFTFSANGEAGSSWMVYSSPDLKTWTPVGSKTLVGGVATYTDPNEASVDSRFYKLSDGTYSSRVVGFYRVSAGVGYTPIANQLDISADDDASQNTPANVFHYSTATLPPGTVFIKGTDTSHPYTWNGSSWTGNGNPTLSPGEAGYIQNTSGGTVTLTFAGYVREGNLPLPLSKGISGGNFVSSRLPLAGGIQTELGYQPASDPNGGDTVSIWKQEDQQWRSLQYFNAADATAAMSLDGTAYPAGWYDNLAILHPEPTVKIGEPFNIQPVAQNESWTQVYSSGFGKIMPSLSGVQATDSTFAFSANGEAGSLWTVYSSPDLKTWTPVGSKTLVGGVATYTDPNVTGADSRFYKLSDGTYSSRVVGFYRVSAGVGYTPIANQLDISADDDASQNTPANVFHYSTATLPPGTVFIKGTDTSHPYTWNGSSWTGNGNPTLSPGEAGYIQNTSGGTVTLTFAGYVREGNLPLPLLTGTSGSSFVSSRLPLTGGVQTVLNYQPTSSDTVHIWQPENHGWLILQYFNAADATAALSLDGTAYPAGWYDGLGTLSPEPTAKMGYPLIIYPATQNESWTQVYSSSFGKIVPSLSGVQVTDSTFAFSANGEAGSSWMVYSSPDLKIWTPVGSKTLVGGVATYTDPNVANADSHFYKLSDGTYSSRVVGFYRVSAGVGYTPIANQLDISADDDASQNTPANVFHYSTATLPPGTVFIKGTDTSHPYTWNGSSWTGNGNPTLSPGEAGYIQNTSGGTVTLTFAGYVREGNLPLPLLTGTSGSSFVSSRLPLTGGVQTVLNYQPTSSDTVHIWQPENHGWLILQYFNAADATAALSLDGTAYPAGWYDGLGTLSPEPTAKMGYPLIIYPATQNESWTQSFSAVGH